MALQIVWTENGLEDYKQVVDYLLQEWPIKVASEFVTNVDSRIETLSVFPEIGIASVKEPAVRSIILTRHNKLYYKISEHTLEILNIFDSRQNPAKNKYD
jgi:plasmid stabilization system protein ParE